MEYTLTTHHSHQEVVPYTKAIGCSSCRLCSKSITASLSHTLSQCLLGMLHAHTRKWRRACTQRIARTRKLGYNFLCYSHTSLMDSSGAGRRVNNNLSPLQPARSHNVHPCTNVQHQLPTYMHLHATHAKSPQHALLTHGLITPLRPCHAAATANSTTCMQLKMRGKLKIPPTSAKYECMTTSPALCNHD